MSTALLGPLERLDVLRLTPAGLVVHKFPERGEEGRAEAQRGSRLKVSRADLLCALGLHNRLASPRLVFGDLVCDGESPGQERQDVLVDVVNGFAQLADFLVKWALHFGSLPSRVK